MHRFKRDELVFLLGAGASVEADVPHSRDMIARVETLLAGDDDEWRNYAPLYHYVKSAILFGDGMKGRTERPAFNIERLVETLEELSKRDEHPLYPFVGAWNPKLPEVAGADFANVGKFRNAIVKRLRDDWIPLGRVDAAEYYRGLLRLQEEYQHPLRVFSLNYDLCVEEWCRRMTGRGPQRGFFHDRRWSWRLLADSEGEGGSEEDLVYLYKLHGSIDWRYDKGGDGSLTYSDNPTSIPLAESALIFGTTYKLQYADPFLFLAYEFRRWSLEARLIIAVGYGFADPHINEILRQALDADSSRILLSVSPSDNPNPDQLKEEARKIAALLGTRRPEQVVRQANHAKQFFEQASVEGLGKHVAGPEELFDEVT